MKSGGFLRSQIIFLFCSLLICTNAYALVTNETEVFSSSPENERPEVWVTIFVHGIISVKPHLNIENLIRFLRDEIENTHYEKTVRLIRDDPFFYQNQAMQKLGLQPVELYPLRRGAGASLMAYTINEIEKMSQPEEPTDNIYYTFGWSGLMSRAARYNEAKTLFKGLVDIQNKLRKQGFEPRFRIIGYSHGGQLILTLAKVRQQENIDKNLRIEETLLYGMPVHLITAPCVNDPLFVKIYNIYSPGDRVQKLDIFSTGEFRSSQYFSHRHLGNTKPKLIQLEIRVLRKAGTCADSYDPYETFHYTGRHKSYLLRDVSPGHTELWFFGWTPLNYRPTFPLYPLPIVALTPYIINTLRPFEEELLTNPAVPVIMTLYPRNNVALLKKADACEWQTVPFISEKKMYHLRKELEKYTPNAFTNELYNYHMKVAYDEAHLFHTQRKKDLRILKEAEQCTKRPRSSRVILARSDKIVSRDAIAAPLHDREAKQCTKKWFDELTMSGKQKRNPYKQRPTTLESRA